MRKPGEIGSGERPEPAPLAVGDKLPSPLRRGGEPAWISGEGLRRYWYKKGTVKTRRAVAPALVYPGAGRAAFIAINQGRPWKPRRGGCNCGAVRLQAEGPPLRTGLCHCLTCRKATGSVFNACGIWPRDQVVVTGETRHWKNRHFCPGCGSSIFGLSEEGDEIEVQLGSLDAGPGDLAPSYELWIKRREHWLTPLPGVAQHVEDRPQ